jgi:hypothetical protein
VKDPGQKVPEAPFTDCAHCPLLEASDELGAVVWGYQHENNLADGACRARLHVIVDSLPTDFS